MKATDYGQHRLRLGEAVFDVGARHLVDQDGHPVALREKSLRVLAELARRNGQTVGRDDLISAVWAGRSVSDDSLVQCIKDIRAALGDNERQLLRTAVGRGYSLHGVREMTNSPGQPPMLLISGFRVGDNEQELTEIAEVITEELIIALSPRAGLKVTTDEDQRETANYAIEGRVSLTGGSLRVFVQLVRGQSGDVAFAETWTCRTPKASTLPGQITDKVASVLRVHMYNHAGENDIHRDNDELDTQGLLAKAAYHMSRIQLQNRDAARAALSLAIEREPDNAMALAMRASTSVLLVLQEGMSSIPDTPDYCFELAERAVGIAPHVDFVMLTRGCLRLWLSADHDGARADFERALSISPVFHLAHQFMAVSEILTGEHASGIARVKKVMELGTTTNPRTPHYLALQALGQMIAGDSDIAALTARESYERAPGDPWCNYIYAAAVADQEEITSTERFRRMITSINLPFTHFRDLPFTDPRDIDMLERRLSLAGYPRSS